MANRMVTWSMKGQGGDHSMFGPEMAGNTDCVTVEHLYKWHLGYEQLVMCPMTSFDSKGQGHVPDRLGCMQISRKSGRDRGSVPKGAPKRK